MGRTLSQGIHRSAATGAPSWPASRPRAAVLVSFVALASFHLLGCGPSVDRGATARDAGDGHATAEAAYETPFVWPVGAHPKVTLRIIGNLEAANGEIEIELYPELAPETVANFLALANEGFYDGTTFHRVIPGFMIQGGDPNTRDRDPRNDGQGGPDHTIPDEFNAAPHLRGVVSMANSGHKNSGGSQFFIVHEDARHLDGRHTVFGRVTRGMDVVDAITTVEVDLHGRWGPANRPIENIVIADVDTSHARLAVRE